MNFLHSHGLLSTCIIIFLINPFVYLALKNALHALSQTIMVSDHNLRTNDLSDNLILFFLLMPVLQANPKNSVTLGISIFNLITELGEGLQTADHFSELGLAAKLMWAKELHAYRHMLCLDSCMLLSGWHSLKTVVSLPSLSLHKCQLSTLAIPLMIIIFCHKSISLIVVLIMTLSWSMLKIQEPVTTTHRTWKAYMFLNTNYSYLWLKLDDFKMLNSSVKQDKKKAVTLTTCHYIFRKTRAL